MILAFFEHKNLEVAVPPFPKVEVVLRGSHMTLGSRFLTAGLEPWELESRHGCLTFEGVLLNHTLNFALGGPLTTRCWPLFCLSHYWFYPLGTTSASGSHKIVGHSNLLFCTVSTFTWVHQLSWISVHLGFIYHIFSFCRIFALKYPYYSSRVDPLTYFIRLVRTFL